MSCNLVFATALLLANDPSSSNPAPQPVTVAAPLMQENLFRSLTEEAARLRSVVSSWMAADILNDPHFSHSSGFVTFKADTLALSAANMQGHLTLKERGTDGDLTCILRGIAEDLPKKLALVEEAAPGAARQQAFEELAYLLNDNVEVITTPPPPSAPAAPSR